MVKINLLPIYILERSRVRRTAVAVGLLLVLQIIALVLVVIHAKAKVAMEQDRAKYWGDVATVVDDVATMTRERESAVGPYEQWVTWVDSQKVYNSRVADLLTYMAHFVHAKVALQSFTWTGTSVTLAGATDSLETAKQFYLNMLDCPIAATVQFQVQVPGWNPSQPTALRRPGVAGPYALPGTTPQGTGYGAPSYGVRQVNPKESVPVSLGVQLRPEYVPLPSPPPISPSQLSGGGGATPARGPMPTGR
jgi:hypothetical protein